MEQQTQLRRVSVTPFWEKPTEWVDAPVPLAETRRTGPVLRTWHAEKLCNPTSSYMMT